MGRGGTGLEDAGGHHVQRNVIWSAENWLGMEHLRLTVDDAGAVGDGLVVGVVEGRPFRIRSIVRCDEQWRVREVRVTVLDGETPGLYLLSDGEGSWTTEEGEWLPLLDGCIDVDLSVSPFTNTLPIRRLPWRQGDSRDLQMVYISAPSLRVQPDGQRYTCVEELSPAGGLFRYDSLDSDFTADLPVDGDGLVLDYPGLFRRVWSGE